MLQAAKAIGVPPSIAKRKMAIILKNIVTVADDLIEKLEGRKNLGVRVSDSNAAKLAWAGESRLLRAIRHNVLAHTVQQLQN